ncbi:MAG: pitrilysin family protein [Nanoarchaeota archaeon]
MTILNGNFRHYELDNGLVVAMQETPTQIIDGKLRVNYAAVHEADNERGLAHFLEHCLVTGGSQKYSPSESDRLRGDFGYTNAQTAVGRTIFPVKILPEDLEPWLDLISDSVFNPRLSPDRVEGERGRVIREISDSKSNPHYSSYREISDLFYRGHPKGIYVLGDERVVEQADIGKLREFHRRGYNANNMDLVLVGNLPKHTEQLIQTYFGKRQKGKSTRIDFPELTPLEERAVSHISSPHLLNKNNPNASSASLDLYLAVAPEKNPDSYALRTIAVLLGGDTNSRFFKNIGLEKGLAYNCSAAYAGDYNAGVFAITAKVSALRLEESLDAIFHEMKKLKDERINEDELNHIRKTIKFYFANTFDSNSGHVDAIEEKLDNNRTAEQIIDGFNNVTPERIMETARKYLPSRESGKYSLVIADPLKK